MEVKPSLKESATKLSQMQDYNNIEKLLYNEWHHSTCNNIGYVGNQNHRHLGF